MCWVVLFQALSRGVGIEDYKANTYQVGDKMVEYQEITHQTNSLLVLEERLPQALETGVGPD